MVASIHGWTGSVLVSTQSTFGHLLARPEVDRTGVYILYGPDPEDILRMRAYIGEADSVKERIGTSAGDRGFWVAAVVVTTSDESLTKGHVRYLEARLIALAHEAGRVALDNTQFPDADKRRLPEADRANMEAFLANLKVVLPVIGVELLKTRPQIVKAASSGEIETTAAQQPEIRFEIRHKSGVKAVAAEEEGEFVVLEGSQAVRDAGHAYNAYSDLRKELTDKGILSLDPEGKFYRFAQPHVFKSPSAASSVILDRNSNGRSEWKVAGQKLTYHQWQESKVNSVEKDDLIENEQE